jgi:hypothetical protein
MPEHCQAPLGPTTDCDDASVNYCRRSRAASPEAESLGIELGLEPEPVEHRDRSKDGEQPFSILSFAQSSSNVDHVAMRRNLVDMSKVADVTANLGRQIGLEIFGPSLLEQGVGMIFVGDGEFQPIDHFADTRRLLGGPVNDHRLIG